jgi:hypothetical protein
VYLAFLAAVLLAADLRIDLFASDLSHGPAADFLNLFLDT